MPVRYIASPPIPPQGAQAGSTRTPIPIPSLQTDHSAYPSSSYPSTSVSTPSSLSTTHPPPRPARSPRRLTMTRSAPAPPAPAPILPPPRSSSLLLSPTLRGPKAPFTPIAHNVPWATQGPLMQRQVDGQGSGPMHKGKGKEVYGRYADRRDQYGHGRDSSGPTMQVEQTTYGQVPVKHAPPTRPTVRTAQSNNFEQLAADTSSPGTGLAVDVFTSPVDTLSPATPRTIPSIHSLSPGTPRKTSPLSPHARSPNTPRKEPIPLLLLQQRYLKSNALASASIRAHYPSLTTCTTSTDANGKAQTRAKFDIQDHPDVLDHVLRHLRKPAPKANDGAVRSDFRQPDLVACMRVSTVFNRATAPILYKRVITDDLLLLLEGIGQFAVRADVPSKLECLRYIRHFTLEYPDLDRHLPFRQALLSNPHASAEDVKRRRAALVQEEEDVLASLEAALAILSTYVDVSDGNEDLRFDRYNTYPLRLNTLALGGNLSHVPEQLEIKASHGGCDRTFPKKGFFWCATRDLLWNSLVIPSRPRLICMHPLAQEMFLPCFKHFTTPPRMCLHVADWVNPPLIKPAPKGEIIIKHSRPHRAAGTRDSGARENPFFRTGRGERLFAIGRNAACWTDDGDERDLACKYLVEYSAMSLTSTLRDGAQRYNEAERKARAENEEPVMRDQWSRCNVEIYASSDVPSRRQGVLSTEDQRKVVNKAWDRAMDELGEDGLRLWDVKMGLLDEAPQCPACGA